MARSSSWLMWMVLQLCIAAFVLHRLGWMSTGLALPLFGVALFVSVIALVLSLLALRRIWQTGEPGATAAATGFVLSGAMLAGAGIALAMAGRYPGINDVTTDIANPPAFEIIASRRPRDANSPVYDADRNATVQKLAYPDIAALETRRSAPEAYDVVLTVARKQGWRIVAAGAPGEGGPMGEVEAIDRTLIMGFYDDVAIRVTPVGEEGARVDIRSASRYGGNDLGRNADRVRNFLNELQRAIESGELTAPG